MSEAIRVIDEASRGVGVLGRSQPDEPVFVLVARDALAAEIIREWADRLEARTVALGELTAKRKAKIAEARALAVRFDQWRVRVGGRLPE